MSTTYLHGVRQTINEHGYTPMPIVATSIIGMLVTADDADSEMFPVNQAVLITDIPSAIGAAGSTGTLKEALQDIYKEASTEIVVIRVEEGIEDEGTIANIMGDIIDDKRTGLEVFALAQQQCGVQPKVFICPKYDTTESVRLKLANIAEEALGFAYVSFDDAETISDALKARENFSSAYAMPFYNNALAYSTELKADAERYSVAQVAGLRARLDQEKGWHWSISNHLLKEAVGTTKEVTYKAINGYGTGANTLNEKGISVFVRDDGGIKTWGNRTASKPDSSLFFEVYTRTSNFLAEEAAEYLRRSMQDKPMTRAVMEDFRLNYNNRLADHKRAGRILGGDVVLHPKKNGKDDLMQGRPDWELRFTAVPPAESPGLEITLTSDFITELM